MNCPYMVKEIDRLRNEKERQLSELSAIIGGLEADVISWKTKCNEVRRELASLHDQQGFLEPT